jgi:PD-(D/E)XK nuclease superfamily
MGVIPPRSGGGPRQPGRFVGRESASCISRSCVPTRTRKVDGSDIFKEPRKPGNEGRKMALEHEALTERIIGAAIEVHRRLGPGFLESIYENALMIELRKRLFLGSSSDVLEDF